MVSKLIMHGERRVHDLYKLLDNLVVGRGIRENRDSVGMSESNFQGARRSNVTIWREEPHEVRMLIASRCLFSSSAGVRGLSWRIYTKPCSSLSIETLAGERIEKRNARNCSNVLRRPSGSLRYVPQSTTDRPRSDEGDGAAEFPSP